MAKNKWWALIGWLVVLVAIIIPLTFNAPKFDNDITMNGLQ